MKQSTNLTNTGLALLTSAFCFIQISDVQAQAALQGQKNGVKLRPKLAMHERADFIQNRGQVLMIPKKALIHVPDWLQDKVITDGKTEGKLVRIDKFMATNSAWLATYPVSFELAVGKKQFTDQELEQLQTMNKIVVATHGNTPIGISKKAWISDKTQTKEQHNDSK